MEMNPIEPQRKKTHSAIFLLVGPIAFIILLAGISQLIPAGNPMGDKYDTQALFAPPSPPMSAKDREIEMRQLQLGERINAKINLFIRSHHRLPTQDEIFRIVHRITKEYPSHSVIPFFHPSVVNQYPPQPH